MPTIAPGAIPTIVVPEVGPTYPVYPPGVISSMMCSPKYRVQWNNQSYGLKKKNKKGNIRAKRAMQGQPKMEFMCFRCHQPGHIEKDCPTQKGEQKSNVHCFTCGQWGHAKRNCPATKQQSALSQPHQYAVHATVQTKGRPNGQGKGQHRGQGQPRQQGITMATMAASETPVETKAKQIPPLIPTSPLQAQAQMMVATFAEALADHAVVTGTISITC